jgi:hypothetical protein
MAHTHLFINEKSKLSLLVIMEVALQNISFLSISDVGTTLIPMPPCFVQVSVSEMAAPSTWFIWRIWKAFILTR